MRNSRVGLALAIAVGLTGAGCRKKPLPKIEGDWQGGWVVLTAGTHAPMRSGLHLQITNDRSDRVHVVFATQAGENFRTLRCEGEAPRTMEPGDDPELSQFDLSALQCTIGYEPRDACPLRFFGASVLHLQRGADSASTPPFMLLIKTPFDFTFQITDTSRCPTLGTQVLLAGRDGRGLTEPGFTALPNYTPPTN